MNPLNFHHEYIYTLKWNKYNPNGPWEIWGQTIVDGHIDEEKLLNNFQTEDSAKEELLILQRF